MFSLNGTLKKSGSVGRWERKQFIGMALQPLYFENNSYYARKVYWLPFVLQSALYDTDF